MDPLLILIQLEVLVQLKNHVSQFHNPTFQFNWEMSHGYKSRECVFFSRISH